MRSSRTAFREKPFCVRDAPIVTRAHTETALEHAIKMAQVIEAPSIGNLSDISIRLRRADKRLGAASQTALTNPLFHSAIGMQKELVKIAQ